MIYIIGIGPGGSIAYLTERARQVAPTLHSAIYVGEMIGENVRKFFGADRVKVGRIPEKEVLGDIRKAADAGENLALLVPGDPCLYSGQEGRELSVGGYAEWLGQNGVSFEVVPGVSSWMALCAACAIDMTSFEGSQAIHVVSLERMRSQSPGGVLDVARLEKVFSTRPSLVLFQSYACRHELAAILRRHYPGGTKVVVGYKVSWPDERILRMQLGDLDLATLGDDLAKHSIIIVLSDTQ